MKVGDLVKYQLFNQDRFGIFIDRDQAPGLHWCQYLILDLEQQVHLWLKEGDCLANFNLDELTLKHCRLLSTQQFLQLLRRFRDESRTVSNVF